MSRVGSRFLVATLAALLATGWLTARPNPVSAAGTVSLSAGGVAYSEDFNTLATLGTNNAGLPNGWWLAESGTSALNNGAYSGNTGSATAGDVYSYGGSTSLDRAFGTLLSGTLSPTIGASFVNGTGAVVDELAVAYRGEMWRAGVTARGAADRLDFQLSTDATSLTTGTWVDYNGLDFSSPN